MKLMIAGGGTGGHLFPGIALASSWMKHADSPEVFFVGTERGLEKKLVPQAGYRLELIEQSGLKRQGLVKTLKGLVLLPRSLLQSLAIVMREKPVMAVGVGGYAAGPAIVAAWMLGVPTLILEPNAMPGLTNRLLARVARRAVSPYERARAYFGKKFVQAGIPVRPQIAQALLESRTTAEPRTGKTVLVFGGSQGARAINQAVVKAAPAWVARGYTVIHQTGAADFQTIKNEYGQTPVDVREFITDMASAYQHCDLVVCRSGASTLAELALVGKPSILIPLPTAADDHQTKNARAFSDIGAAKLLPQSELTPERLSTEVLSLLQSQEALDKMSTAVSSLGDANAADALCDMCMQLVQGAKS